MPKLIDEALITVLFIPEREDEILRDDLRQLRKIRADGFRWCDRRTFWRMRRIVAGGISHGRAVATRFLLFTTSNQEQATEQWQ